MSPDTPVRTDTQLASRLRLAVMRLARVLRQQTQDPVTPSQVSALHSIEHHEPISLGELAKVERVQAPTLTRIVAALEESGLVVRAVDVSDRRIARLSLTPAGRRLIERSRSRRTAYLAARLRELTDEERDTIERAALLLERMVGDQS
jgi:DNA-binding MarR family transcriptional regulator